MRNTSPCKRRPCALPPIDPCASTQHGTIIVALMGYSRLSRSTIAMQQGAVSPVAQLCLLTQWHNSAAPSTQFSRPQPPQIPVFRRSSSRVPPGMRSIHPHKCHVGTQSPAVLNQRAATFFCQPS